MAPSLSLLSRYMNGQVLDVLKICIAIGKRDPNASDVAHVYSLANCELSLNAFKAPVG